MYFKYNLKGSVYCQFKYVFHRMHRQKQKKNIIVVKFNKQIICVFTQSMFS